MPLPRRLVLLLLAWVPSPGVAVCNAPKAPSTLGASCCRICQNQFNNELSFLEVDDEAKLAAVRGFDAWSQEATGTAFLQTRSEPDRKAPCCSVCVADFVARDTDLDREIVASAGPFSMLPHDPQAPPPRQRQSVMAGLMLEVGADEGAARALAKGAGSAAASRKKGTRSVALLQPIAPQQKHQQQQRQLANELAFLQLGAAAHKGSGNLGGGCCNVCAGQKAGPTLLTGKVVGYGGGSKRTEGGCCTACASRYQGASEFGAPPFGEPGNREQNIGAPLPSIVENMDDFGGRLYNPTHKHQVSVGGLTKRQIKTYHMSV